jgi:hypothetical protein
MKILLEIIVLAAIVVALWPAPVGGRLGIVVVSRPTRSKTSS